LTLIGPMARTGGLKWDGRGRRVDVVQACKVRRAVLFVDLPSPAGQVIDSLASAFCGHGCAWEW